MTTSFFRQLKINFTKNYFPVQTSNVACASSITSDTHNHIEMNRQPQHAWIEEEHQLGEERASCGAGQQPEVGHYRVQSFC